ncbi:MAG TPA: D-glycerate dehydrogenase [Thermoplasmatales archaeon]|nr:D-glycerate dehydrogenase [Thermoplasmatales archaeon]
MAKIFITRRLPEEGLKMLDEHEVEIFEGDAPPSKQEIIEGTRGKDALICLLTDKIDSEVMNASSNLKIIANYAAGYDNIDIDEATKRGIFVTNTPGVLTETVADLAWALILAAARRIVEGDKFMREGKFKGWAPMLLLGSDVYGKTLGIVGAGRIGQAVAKRAKGFNMRILYYSRKRKENFEKECNAEYVDLETLLREADFVSLHTPLTPETYHMIGEKELKMMKSSAYLINTGRGKCVDEKALVKALKEGWIRGAALDVFENEPEIEPELKELENVVLTPHIGSASYETRSRMAVMVAENVLAALKGEIPPNCINPEAANYRD